MATLRQRKAATLAQAAGLSTPVDTTPKFTWTVSGDLGPYKKDEVLSTKEHAVRYIRLALNEGADQETTLTDDQIWEGMKAVNTDELDPSDRDVAAIEYLESLQTTKNEPMRSVQLEKALSENQIAAEAERLGAMADKELIGSVQRALDGKQDWDGGPITICAQLERLYGVAMTGWPVIGTRKTGQTNRKGESRDNVAFDYNMPTDYFKVMVQGEPEVVRWLAIFVEGMPHVHRLVTERKTVLDIEKGTNLALIPDKYAEFCPPKNGFINSPKLKGIADDLSAQITRNINRIGIAIAFYQTQQAIKDKLSDLIKFSLVDGTAEASAKRTKPIQMAGRNKKEEEFTVAGRPISLSAFIRYGRFVDQCKEQGGSLAKLQDLDKQSRKRIPQAAAVTKTEVELAIDNVHTFNNVLSTLHTYIERNASSIKAQLASREGGALASALVLANDKLSIFADEKAVKDRADAYDKLQIESVAAADKATAKPAKVA